MIGALLTWSVLALGPGQIDGCHANNPYLYFPYMDHGDSHVADREAVTVVPRPIIGLGINWAKSSVNADFAAGVDLQVLACQVHPVPHVAAHVLLRARRETGWAFEPGIGFSWLPDEMKFPGSPPWIVSELAFELGPSLGLDSSLSGVHARLAYWFLYHAIGVEAGVRYDAGRWVPAITVQLDAMLLSFLISWGVRAGAGSSPSKSDTTRW